MAGDGAAVEPVGWGVIPVDRVLASDPAVVTLDIDGTLVRYRRSPDDLIRLAFDRLDTEPLFSGPEYSARFEEFAQQTDSITELRRACFGTLAVEAGGDRETGHAVAEIYDAERDQTNVEPVPGAAELLDRLADRGIPRPVVTNGPPDSQRPKLAAVGFTDRVGPTVFAGHDCPPKPDPEPFERALRAVDLPADTDRTVVHVGDSDDDADGAANAGVQFVGVGPTD